MKLARNDVFICNVLKCRPPENRRPNPDEVDCCEPYLVRQLAIIKPTVICALGATAAQTLLKTGALVGQLRGRWHNYHNIPLRVTYHPAYLLRSPGEKIKTWEDIQEVMKLLNGQIPRPF
jgi:DNA polymerase